MKHVSDQLHALGLKFGMYSSAGVYTCGGYAGSLDLEQVDADFWAANGVDYLKYDNWCVLGLTGRNDETRRKPRANEPQLQSRPRRHPEAQF